MLSSVGKKYTVGDVYKEAAKLLKDEMGGLKKGGLSKTEEIKMEEKSIEETEKAGRETRKKERSGN